MRRADREIKSFDEIIEVMNKCSVCRLALNSEEYPYIVPLNFGIKIEGQSVILYFHSALQGTKLDLIRRNNRASFEMDCGHTLEMNEKTGNCTMNYESVIGKGKIEFVPDEEKNNALKILMTHYHREEFPFNPKMLSQTEVFRLIVSEMTGKRRTGKA